MKIPIDLDAKNLINLLERLGYKQTRQAGSHIRLSVLLKEKSYHI